MSITARIGILGLAFVALFTVLTLKLWTVQVTATDEYIAKAESNQVKLVDTPAPRGEIRDRDGRLLAGTRPALAAIVDGALVPPAEDEGMAAYLQRLSTFSGIAVGEVQEVVDTARTRGDRLTLAADLTEDQALRLIEYEEDFPGVSVLPQPVRVYPQGELAADIVGYIGRPNEEDLERPEIGLTDTVGRAGVERQYDDDLRGTAGKLKFGVDAQRSVVNIGDEQPPQPGDNVELTIDLQIQEVLEESLSQGLELARAQYDPECKPGPDDPRCPVRAVGVVMDPRSGAVLAMAGVPSYDPNVFVGGLSQEDFEALSEIGAFNNFVIQGEYAPASAFKAVAYFMAAEEGIYPVDEDGQSDTGEYFCTGSLEFPFNDGSAQVLNDWTRAGHGAVDLHTGLQASCDPYFWQVALNVWTNRQRADGDGDYPEDLLQQWAREFGFDEETGIDLPFERDGLIPDREWFERAQQETPGLVREGPWTGGDVMNAVIGQGSVLATPIQLANAFSAMVNGGTLFKPRVVGRILDQDGNVVRENEPEVLNEVDVQRSTVNAFRRDLQQTVNGAVGTARSAFADFGEGVEWVGGKTGTGSVIRGETPAEDVDNAVFVGVAPVNAPDYVVAVLIERGGSGGSIAAPTTRRVLQYLMNGRTGMTDIVTPAEDAD